MQRPQELLRGKKPVGDDPRKKRRNHRPDRRAPVRPPNLSPFEFQRLREIRPHRDIPRPPNEVVQKNHDPQPDDQEWGHWRSTSVDTGILKLSSVS